MESANLHAHPLGYVRTLAACGTGALFRSSWGMVGLPLQNWVVNSRLVLASIREEHLLDLYQLTELELAEKMPQGMPLLGLVNGLYPWLVGLLQARSHVPHLRALLLGAHRPALYLSLMSSLVLLDDPQVGSLVLEFLRAQRVCVHEDCQHESVAASCLHLLDQQHGTTWLADSGLATPSHPARRLARAVAWGECLRGGIPVADRVHFQTQLSHLLALSTHWELLPQQATSLLPAVQPLSRNDFNEWIQSQDAAARRPSDSSRVGQPHGRQQKTLPVTEAIVQLAHNGLAPAQISHILHLLASPQSPHDLSCAIELDIFHRLPVQVVAAIYLNLIRSFPLYYDNYHRYAIHLLLCSNRFDTQAQSLYAQGDALRAKWHIKHHEGCDVPMLKPEMV